MTIFFVFYPVTGCPFHTLTDTNCW